MKNTKLSLAITIALLGSSHQLMASQNSQFALTHFNKGCLSSPLKTNPAFKYFQSLPGFKAWGPERKRKAGTSAMGAPVAQMRGIFLFRNASKTRTFVTSGGFGETANCMAEFKPDLSWDAWVKEAEGLIGKQSGFTGGVTVKKNGKMREYKTALGVFRIVNIKNKAFQLQIANK